MRYIYYGLIAVFAAMVQPVSAQVFKCTTADGKLVYSDKRCPAGGAGGMIQRERTYAEKMQEREEAYDAEVRKQNRRMAQEEREWAEQQQYQSAPVARHPGNDWESRKQQENAATSASSITNNGSRWDAGASARRGEARRQSTQTAPVHPPSSMTTCSGGICQDNLGGSYHRAGRDFMTGPNGQVCHRAGNMWNCN